MLKPVYEVAEVSMRLDIAKDIVVKGDAGQLTQLFINLISNAIKFSNPHGTVDVSLSINHDGVDEMARISITDHGIGIPENDIPLLFTRFFRAGNVNSGSHPGTGLGLAIVKQIIDHHDGTIEVLSELGKGSSFLIEIPIMRGA
jgi:two-component system phosphate regulon sensor histidine kinase PhoR